MQERGGGVGVDVDLGVDVHVLFALESGGGVCGGVDGDEEGVEGGCQRDACVEEGEEGGGYERGEEEEGGVLDTKRTHRSAILRKAPGRQVSTYFTSRRRRNLLHAQPPHLHNLHHNLHQRPGRHSRQHNRLQRPAEPRLEILLPIR